MNRLPFIYGDFDILLNLGQQQDDVDDRPGCEIVRCGKVETSTVGVGSTGVTCEWTQRIATNQTSRIALRMDA